MNYRKQFEEYLRSSKIRKIYRVNLQQKVLSLTERSKGFENRIFLVITDKSQSVMRMPAKESDQFYSPKYQLLREYWASCAWFKSNLPVPKVVLFDDSKHLVSFIYLIETKIDGEDLAESHLTHNELKHVMTQLGKYLRRMHEVKTRDYGLLADNLRGKETSWNFIGEKLEASIRNLGFRKLLSQKHIARLEDFFERHERVLHFSDPRLLHNDIHADHIRIKNGKIEGIVDFGDAMSGDPIYDLCRAYQGLWCHGFDRDYLGVLVNAYGSLDETKISFYLLCHACWTLEYFNYKNLVEPAKRSKQLIEEVLRKA